MLLCDPHQQSARGHARSAVVPQGFELSVVRGVEVVLVVPDLGVVTLALIRQRADMVAEPVVARGVRLQDHHLGPAVRTQNLGV